MNEQQLADLLSEQIDGILQGHQPVTPAGAADLQPLLTLGQQFSQINVQPTATAQAAFQSQLSAWFGPVNGATATIAWGLSKTWLITLTAAVITIGAALGVVMLTSSSKSQLDSQQQIVPNASESPGELPEIPAPNNNQATPVPSLPQAAPTSNATVSDGDTLSPSSSSTGDTLSPTTSSAGDTLPSEPVLEEPTSEPSPTPEFATDAGDGPGGDSASGGDDDSSGDGSNNDSDDGSGDHDRGHGNDEDGFDEDNPGNSSGLPGSDQGNNSGNGLDFGQFSSGGNNGGGNGGQGGGNGAGNGNNGNRGNGGNGQGRGKGNK